MKNCEPALSGSADLAIETIPLVCIRLLNSASILYPASPFPQSHGMPALGLVVGGGGLALLAAGCGAMWYFRFVQVRDHIIVIMFYIRFYVSFLSMVSIKR